MCHKIFYMPLSNDGNHIIVMAKDETDAGQIADAELSKVTGLVANHCVKDYFTIDTASEAKHEGIFDLYPLGHCGETVGEFLSEDEEYDF